MSEKARMIRSVIEEKHSAYYDAWLAEAEDPAVQRQLSSLCRAAVLWYPFSDTASVLEAGSGYGAYTGALTEIFDQVCILRDQNTDLVLARHQNGKIFVLTEEEAAERTFSHILIPDAAALTQEQIRNRLSLLSEDGTALLFFPECGDAETEPEKTRRTLAKHGYHIQRFTAAPDLSFVQEVRAEDTAVGNGGTVILEAGCGALCGIRQAYISADRGLRGTVTRIFESTVTKQAVTKEGSRFIEEQAAHLQALSEKGVRILPAKPVCENGRQVLLMERITQPTLAAEIAGEPVVNEEILYPIFDRLLGEIRKAPGFFDMIPSNAFRDEDGLVFFDQEFYKENAPAVYTLYRALRYTWENCPNVRANCSLGRMLRHYGISEEDETALKKEEDGFTYEVRNGRLYGWLFGRMKEKPVRKEAEPVREDVRSVQLDLLAQFRRVCEDNGLTYIGIFGTMLGAARHGGVIPWDDDIDLAMPREDYDRLLALAPDAFDYPYFLQTPENDKNCFYGGYAKLRNSDTAALEWFNRGRRCNQGIFIDIFPLDYCGNTETEITRQQRIVYLRQRMIYAKRYPLWAGRLIDSDPKKLSLYYIAAGFFTDSALLAKLRKTLTRHKRSETMTVFACYYAWRGNHNRFRAADLEEIVKLPFSGTEIPVPANYKKWLKDRYGENYMDMPPERARRPHHDAEYHPDTPYTEYI